MKRLLCYITILICTSICSCTKMDTSNNRDDADAFIGTYSITIVEDVVWGNDSGTLNDNGTLQIKKTSANKVQLISEFIMSRLMLLAITYIFQVTPSQTTQATIQEAIPMEHLMGMSYPLLVTILGN